MVREVAEWVAAPEQKDLWKSRPVKGDIGIVYVPETQLFAFAQQGSTEHYALSMQGAYRGFFDNNIQADWVHIDHIDEYDALYLPLPFMLEEATANRLRCWVEAGGTLISEGCPAYFGDNGHVGTRQPNFGLDELFGAEEEYVEFTPDLLGDLDLTVSEAPVWGGIFLQAYSPTAGQATGWYADGRIAAVDHRHGKGRTRLIGTMPGWGHAAHAGSANARFFSDCLAFAGRQPSVASSDTRIKARLHQGVGGTYLWVANPTRRELPVRLELAGTWGPFSASHSLWGPGASVRAQTVELAAPARDVCVISLS